MKGMESIPFTKMFVTSLGFIATRLAVHASDPLLSVTPVGAANWSAAHGTKGVPAGNPGNPARYPGKT
jgi:hypothetical protein